MTSDDVYDDILNYPYWRQRIDFGDGRCTPGKRSADDWDRLRLPENMSGKSFLDIGCSDGLHAFEAERRGADKVLATDLWEEDPDDGWWFSRTPRRKGFELAKKYLNSDVEGQRLDIRDLSRERVGTFDVVLCSKVLPFVPCPADIVQRLVNVTDEMLVIESATSLGVGRIHTPALELAKSTTANDNRWWHPNQQALADLLELAHENCRPSQPCKISTSLVAGDARRIEGNAEVVDDGAKVFQDYNLREQVDEIPPRVGVTILARHESAIRVEYKLDDSEPYRQGWICPSSINPQQKKTGPLNELRNLAGQVTDYVRSGEITRLTRKAIHYFRYRYYDHPQSNILAQYRVSD